MSRVIVVLILMLSPGASLAVMLEDFLTADQVSCDGNLPVFRSYKGKFTKIAANDSRWVVDKSSTDALLVGVSAERPWLTVWPWFGVHFKRNHEPKLRGAKITFQTNSSNSFLVEMFFEKRRIGQLRCRVSSK